MKRKRRGILFGRRRGTRPGTEPGAQPETEHGTRRGITPGGAGGEGKRGGVGVAGGAATACILLGFFVYFALPLSSPFYTGGYSTVVYAKDGTVLRVFLSPQQQYHFPPNSEGEIPRKLEKAVLSFEDSRFYSHPGTDVLALARALSQNIRDRQRVSGGSTITMQLLRIVNPKERSYVNKVKEILRAIKLELHWPKEKILRSYLEHAPYGGNVVGYRSALFAYFGKQANSITWAEAALLAVLPNDPSSLRPGENTPALKKKRDRLLQRMFESGYINSETLELSKAEPLPSGRKKSPFHTPHLCERAFYTFGERGEVRTTVDLDIQKQAKRVAEVHRQKLEAHGIPNMAVFAAEMKSGKARVYIGSQDYWDTGHSGKVDAVYEAHTVGSILKPFLYAAAMDEGMLIPATKLEDVPVRYGTFSPQNIDRSFHGLVSAESALQRSLNVPAVNILHDYGIEKFYQKLLELGVSSLTMGPKEYGLPLILGSPEINLIEIASMYRSLAKLGIYAPVRLFPADGSALYGPSEAAETGGEAPAQRRTPQAQRRPSRRQQHNSQLRRDPQEQRQRVFSRGASYLTLEMLKGVKRPGSEYMWERFLGSKPVAWKTGTSYGQRDGWAVGVSPDWVVVVWVGSVAAEENPGLTGYKYAAPLMLDIFNILPSVSESRWFEKPEDHLKTVKVVPETGYRAPPEYPSPVKKPAPAGAKGLPLDPYYRVLPVRRPEEGEETHIVCSLCWEDKEYAYEGFFIYPPDLAAVRAQQGRADTIPPHNPHCPAAGRGEGAGVSVTYPGEGLSIWIPKGQNKVVLKGYHGQKNETLHWYIDSAYYGSTENGRHTKAVALESGTHTLYLIDSKGRSDKVRFSVETSR